MYQHAGWCTLPCCTGKRISSCTVTYTIKDMYTIRIKGSIRTKGSVRHIKAITKSGGHQKYWLYGCKRYAEKASWPKAIKIKVYPKSILHQKHDGRWQKQCTLLKVTPTPKAVCIKRRDTKARRSSIQKNGVKSVVQKELFRCVMKRYMTQKLVSSHWPKDAHLSFYSAISRTDLGKKPVAGLIYLRNSIWRKKFYLSILEELKFSCSIDTRYWVLVLPIEMMSAALT